MNTREVLELAKQIKGISETGLTYCTDHYNIERYSELSAISTRLIHLITGESYEKLQDFYLNLKEYTTPKTDVRAVIFNEEGQILMVRESIDDRWSIPGGWADIGYTPAEVVIKEVQEETGFKAKPTRLLAVMDKRMHLHPPQAEYVYKLFFECTITGGEINPAADIREVNFFSQNELPPLSADRITQAQLDLLFGYFNQPGKLPHFE